MKQMTDIETIRGMFKRTGIIFDEETSPYDSKKKMIHFDGETGPKNKGHYGTAGFCFNEDGSLFTVFASEN